MRSLAVFVGILMFGGCHSGEVEAGPEGGNAGQVGGAGSAESRVSWDGEHAGQLVFSSAACMIMNGEIINFYAPAKAKDGIGGEPVVPQINGTKAGEGWAANILTADQVAFSGAGEGSAEADRALKITATLLDGISAKRNELATVTAEFDVHCTDIDDLGNF